MPPDRVTATLKPNDVPATTLTYSEPTAPPGGAIELTVGRPRDVVDAHPPPPAVR